MQVKCGGVGVLLSSYAQESQNAGTLQKFYNQISSQNRSKCQCGLIARKIPLEVTTQLLIFRYHDTTGAIDVILLRVGRQQVDHFVGALWICSVFSSVGTGANIR